MWNFLSVVLTLQVTFIIGTNVKQHFTFHNVERNFTDAKLLCEGSGMRMLKVETLQESDYVINLIKAGREIGNANFHVWIGLRKDKYGTAKWTDGSIPTWTNYSERDLWAREDDGPNTNCYALNSHHRDWVEKMCTERLGFVCEMDIGNCTFEHSPPGKGCNHDGIVQPSYLDKQEISQSDCQMECLNIGNNNDVECWAAAFLDGCECPDCWLFFTKATDYCVQNEDNYDGVSLFIKTCFQGNTSTTLAEAQIADEMTTPANDPITTEDVIAEATETMKTETSTTKACTCSCTNNKSKNQTATSTNTTAHLSPEEIQESIDKIVRDIKVNKNSTSQYKRKLNSSPDDRFSARVIGISGVSIVGIISLVIVGFDLKNLYDAFDTMYHRLKNLRKTRSIP